MYVIWLQHYLGFHLLKMFENYCTLLSPGGAPPTLSVLGCIVQLQLLIASLW